MSIDRTKYMSLDEVHQLKDFAKSKGGLVWLVVDMALSTGLRVGELANIKTTDIDFKRGFMTVMRLKKNPKSKKRKKPPKPQKPDILPLGKDILKHLRKSVNGQEYLFIGQRGKLTRQGLQRIWSKAVERAGLRHYSIHSARHTYGTHHHTKHKNLRALQLLLGHENVETTAKYYAGVTFEQLQESVDNLY